MDETTRQAWSKLNSVQRAAINAAAVSRDDYHRGLFMALAEAGAEKTAPPPLDDELLQLVARLAAPRGQAR